MTSASSSSTTARSVIHAVLFIGVVFSALLLLSQHAAGPSWSLKEGGNSDVVTPPPPAQAVRDDTPSEGQSAKTSDSPVTQQPDDATTPLDDPPTTRPPPARGGVADVVEWPPRPWSAVRPPHIERLSKAACAAVAGPCGDRACRVQARRSCVSLMEPVPPVAEKPSRKQVARTKAALKQGLRTCAAAARPTNASIAAGCSKLLYIDAGANTYRSSIQSFRSWYARGGEFFIDAYEIADFVDTYPADELYLRPSDVVSSSVVTGNSAATAGGTRHGSVVDPVEAVRRQLRYTRAAISARTGYLSFLRKGANANENEKTQISSTASYVTWTATKQERPKDAWLTVPAIGICELLDTLVVSDGDWVVLKVDVEGGEWEILGALDACTPPPADENHKPRAEAEGSRRTRGRGWELVDELLLECHHEGLGGAFQGVPFSRCKQTITTLRRERGVLAHFWV